MPAFVRVLTPDGLEAVEYEAESLADAARHEPTDGVYTVTNTYHRTQVLKLDAHLDRLEDSARRAGIALALDRPRLRAALRTMIEAAGYGDVRFRISVPRSTPERLILTMEPFRPPAVELIERGVRVITAADSARQDAATKSTQWMHERERLANAQPAGIYDTILLDGDGNLMEGLAANFYAVIGGVLRTAGEGVLPGIARQIVLEVAPGVVAVELVAPNLRDQPRMEEAFITSSSRGIIPVVEIDGQALGDGVPGAITRQLLGRYRAWVDAHLEEL